jgi:uncharacterized protein (DUF3084 family)
MADLLSIEELERRIDNVRTRHQRMLRRKAELGGELKSKKEELARLIKEIQDAGYNPKTLVEDRDKAQAELQSLLEDFERNVQEAEQSLAEYDKR